MRKQRKAEKKAKREADEKAGFQLTVKGEASPVPIVYGRQKVGGVLADVRTEHDYVYSDTSAARDSSWIINQSLKADIDYKLKRHRNRFLITQYAICQGEIEEIKYLEVDDVPFNDKEFQQEGGGHYIVQYNDGGTACSLATANNLNSNNKFTDCAFATGVFWLDREEPQYYQIPALGFYVKGKKIPLIVDNGDSTYTYNRAGTLTYSNNPALVLLDYLTGEYGMNLDLSDIDLASFYASAVTCAQTVNPAAGLGAIERRGRIWEGRKDYSQDIEALAITTVAGQSHLVFSGYNFSNINLNLSAIQTAAAAAGYVGNSPSDTQGYYSIDFTNSSYNSTDDVIEVPLSDVTAQDGAATISTADTIDNTQLGQLIAYTNSNADSLPLYECNVVLDPSSPVRDNVASILNSMPNADLIWSEGKFKLYTKYFTTQAALRTEANNTMVVTDDLLRTSSITTIYPSADVKLNSASVRYLDEQENFKTKTVTWPEKNSTVHTTYLSEDNNVVLNTTLNGDGITDPYHATALAEQTVRESRNAIQYQFEMFSEGYSLEPGDIIRLNSELNGLTNADDIVKVEKVSLTENMTVNITATRIHADDFAWNIEDEVLSKYSRATSFKLFPPTLTNTEIALGDINDATVYGYRALPDEQKIFLRWQTSNSHAFDYYEIEWYQGTTVSTEDDDWEVAGRTKSEQFSLFVGDPSTPVWIRLRTISQTGRRSSPSAVVLGAITLTLPSPDSVIAEWDTTGVVFTQDAAGAWSSTDTDAQLRVYAGSQELTRVADSTTLTVDNTFCIVSQVKTGSFDFTNTAFNSGDDFHKTTISNFATSGIITTTYRAKVRGIDQLVRNHKLNVFGNIAGAEGDPGSSVVTYFIRTTGIPTATGTASTPGGSTWFDTEAGTSGVDPLWTTIGTSDDGTTWTWNEPNQVAPLGGSGNLLRNAALRGLPHKDGSTNAGNEWTTSNTAPRFYTAESDSWAGNWGINTNHPSGFAMGVQFSATASIQSIDENTFYMIDSNANASSTAVAFTSGLVPVEGSSTYEAFCWSGVDNCNATVSVSFYKLIGTTMTFISEGTLVSGSSVTNSNASAGGSQLSDYKLTSCVRVAPSDATMARFKITKTKTLNDGSTDSYMVFALPFLGKVNAGVKVASGNWSAGEGTPEWDNLPNRPADSEVLNSQIPGILTVNPPTVEWLSADGGTSYSPAGTSQTATITYTDGVGSDTVTLTWTRSSNAITNAVLSSSSDFSMPTFSGSSSNKTVTITHDSSTKTITANAIVTTFDLGGL